MHTLFATIPWHLTAEDKRPLVCLLIGFLLSFGLTRLNTRTTRARGRSRIGIHSVVTPGGVHIHHSVFGIIGMAVAGILEFALQPGSPWLEALAFYFGGVVALTLDEFALILHLDDVYWTGEGRTSIDAVILGVTFILLLLTGLTPQDFGGVGDVVVLSRWAATALVLSGAAFVIVSYLKGKLFLATVGIFFPPVAVVGALRLAKSNSPWAHSQYARRSPAKLERARLRDEGFNRRWQKRKHVIWDVIGGKPHLHVSHRVSQQQKNGKADDAGPEPGPTGDPGGGQPQTHA